MEGAVACPDHSRKTGGRGSDLALDAEVTTIARRPVRGPVSCVRESHHRDANTAERSTAFSPCRVLSKATPGATATRQVPRVGRI